MPTDQRCSVGIGIRALLLALVNPPPAFVLGERNFMIKDDTMPQAPAASSEHSTMNTAKADSPANGLAPTAKTADQLPKEVLIKWLYDMQLIREFENRTMQAYQQAKIGGFCHIYTGQEAVAVGTIGCTNAHVRSPELALRRSRHRLRTNTNGCRIRILRKIPTRSHGHRQKESHPLLHG